MASIKSRLQYHKRKGKKNENENEDKTTLHIYQMEKSIYKRMVCNSHKRQTESNEIERDKGRKPKGNGFQRLRGKSEQNQK